jgi:predicted HicB family RNase H-like nuclease
MDKLPDKQNLYLRVVPALKRKLDKMAKETGQSINSLIVQACWELVNKQTSR